MEAYDIFASVYDEFMEDIDYSSWTAYILSICKDFELRPTLGLDLGCGTGNMTIRLALEGIDMIGIDISGEMLDIASKKSNSMDLDILYLNQDMSSFELYGTVDIIISLCDSINYITEEDDLLNTFKLVNNYLNPNGLFIFDINTEYKFKEVLGDNNFSQVLPDSAYIWENYYDEAEGINEYSLTLFIKEDNLDTFKKYEEYHYERCYSIEKIKELLDKSGLELLGVYDYLSKKPPKEDSTRIYFVAQEKGKNI